MTKAKKAQKSHLKAVTGSNRVESGIFPPTGSIVGSTTPRIASKPSDLPSKGVEMIEFARDIGMKLMPWQEWLAIESHRVKPDGRWLNSQVCVVVARQSGKTTFQIMRALTGLFVWNEPLQIGTAHRLTTSLETFRHMVSIIEANAVLSSQVKRIRWAHGSEEIELLNGNRYMVKAGGAAARGISRPETIFLDELREMKDLDSFASLRYTAMASKNPMVIGLSNAGDQHSVVLNQLRERGLAAASGAADDIGYFEWSAATDNINDVENWKAANPALGYTIHEDNIRAVLNDPPDVVRTEVLCRWVATISSAIPQDAWNECGEDDLQLDPNATPTPTPTLTPTPTPTPSPTKVVYTMDKVKLNNTDRSCWSVVDGNVYDLTRWINSHPGGAGAIRSMCGVDGTRAFLNQHEGRREPIQRLSMYLLGPLSK